MWLSHILGLDNPSGAWYLWWSGFGGRVGIPTGFAFAYWRHHVCHVNRCVRFGRFQVAGKPTCRRHHPDLGVSFAD